MLMVDYHTATAALDTHTAALMRMASSLLILSNLTDKTIRVPAAFIPTLHTSHETCAKTCWGASLANTIVFLSTLTYTSMMFF